MIDYVNTEIVEYSSEFPTYEDVYPYEFSAAVAHFSTDTFIYNRYTVEVDGVSCHYVYGFLPASGSSAIGLTALQFMGYLYSVNGNLSVSLLDSALYSYAVYNVLPDSPTSSYCTCVTYTGNISQDILDKFNNYDFSLGFNHPDYGSDIYFLYNFGNIIVSEASSVVDFLSLTIGGRDILSLLLISGFSVYFGWVLIKWIIPI